MTDATRITSYDHDGFTFDVRDEGPLDGEVIVLLHGFPESSASWSRVVPHLTDAGYRTLAPNQRGYSPGARPAEASAYTFDSLSGDVLALADAAGAERFHLVGHDWGAGVAWALAANHPDRVRSLVALATPHPNAMSRAMVRSTQLLHSWYMVAFQIPKLPEKLLLAGGGARLSQGLEKAGLPAADAAANAALLQEPGAATGAINWYRGLARGRPADLPRVSVPTTYVWSTKDAYLGRWAAEHTGDWTTGPYRFEILEGVSHWIPEVEPERTAELIVERAAGTATNP